MPNRAYYALGMPLGLYLAIVLAGRREDARALAGFVPDCVVLFTRLLRDKRLPRRHKLLVAALIPYLALPFDLIPDFVPVAGQLDDAVLVAFVLRRIVRTKSRPDPRALAGSAVVASVRSAPRQALASRRQSLVGRRGGRRLLGTELRAGADGRPQRHLSEQPREDEGHDRHRHAEEEHAV
jgi:uncharacterized membrane protein YkvA (DUF1232 family)